MEQRANKEKKMRSAKECQDILELAIGEVEAAIPDDVLEDTIKYLDEYEKIRIEKSWDEFPETVGRHAGFPDEMGRW